MSVWGVKSRETVIFFFGAAMARLTSVSVFLWFLYSAVVKTEEFLALSAEQVCNLISNDNLTAQSEKEVIPISFLDFSFHLLLL